MHNPATCRESERERREIKQDKMAEITNKKHTILNNKIKEKKTVVTGLTITVSIVLNSFGS